MKQKGGRESAAAKMERLAQMNAPADPVAQIIGRPDPPAELTGAQAKIWRDIVNSKPVGWFRADSLPLLIQYCRATTMATDFDRSIQRILKAKSLSAVGARKLRDLYAMGHQNSVLMNRLATSMRLTQQSGYNPAKRMPDEGNDEGLGGKLWQRPE